MTLTANPVIEASRQAQLIFVTGASRSGTTVLSRVLGNNSAVVGLNELHYLGDLCSLSEFARPVSRERVLELIAGLLARQHSGIWDGKPTREHDEAARVLAQKLPESPATGADVLGFVLNEFATASSKTIACEQTPRNIYYVRQLLDAFPNARIVIAVRDPRAVLASQKNRWRLRRLGGSKVPRKELIRTWVNYHPYTMNKLWIRAADAADLWADHSRVIIARFEELVADPKAAITRLCSVLNIEFQEEMLDVPRWGSSNVAHNQEDKGISSEVSDRWKSELSLGEIMITERMCARQMQDLSYSKTANGNGHFLFLIWQAVSYPFHLLGVVFANPKRALTVARAYLLAVRKESSNGS